MTEPKAKAKAKRGGRSGMVGHVPPAVTTGLQEAAKAAGIPFGELKDAVRARADRALRVEFEGATASSIALDALKAKQMAKQAEIEQRIAALSGNDAAQGGGKK